VSRSTVLANSPKRKKFNEHVEGNEIPRFKTLSVTFPDFSFAKKWREIVKPVTKWLNESQNKKGLCYAKHQCLHRAQPYLWTINFQIRVTLRRRVC
jgi:hypothetical protein